MRYQVALTICLAAAVTLLGGCARPEIREIQANEPRGAGGVRSFELLENAVVVRSWGWPQMRVLTADDKESKNLTVGIGDSFKTTGFNSSEQWTLKQLRPREAEFDVRARYVSCLGNWFTGGPDVWYSHWIALVRFPETPGPAESGNEPDTQTRPPGAVPEEH